MVVYVGQIAASLASLSRTVDDYSALSKKELIPAKQEKAFERVKNFRTELGDYRQQFDSLRKAREDAVSFSRIILRLSLTTTAIHVEPQRAPWPSAAPCRDPGKPLRTIRPPATIALRPFDYGAIWTELWRIASRL